MSSRRRMIALACSVLTSASIACTCGLFGRGDDGAGPEASVLPPTSASATARATASPTGGGEGEVATVAPTSATDTGQPTATLEPTAQLGEGSCPGKAIVTLDHVDWAAYQTGDGSWTAVGPSFFEAGEVTVPLDGDCRYGVAYACRREYGSSENYVHIDYYLGDEAGEVTSITSSLMS